MAVVLLICLGLVSVWGQEGSSKRIVSMRADDAPEGSRVTVVADHALNDYEAFRRGDLFHIKVPSANFAARSNVRGKGFENVQVQKSGDGVILSFKLQPGTTARVDQRFNQLDVVFTTLTAGPTTVPAVPIARPSDIAGAYPQDPNRDSRTRTQERPSVSGTGSESAALSLAGAPSGSTDSGAITSSKTPESPNSSSQTGHAAPNGQGGEAFVLRWLMEDWVITLIPALILLALLVFILLRVRSRQRKVESAAQRTPKTDESQETLVDTVYATQVSSLWDSKPAGASEETETHSSTQSEPTIAGEPDNTHEDHEIEPPSKEDLSEVTSLIQDDQTPNAPAPFDRADFEIKKILSGREYDPTVIDSADPATRQVVSAALLGALAGRNVEQHGPARRALMEHGYFDEITQDLRAAQSDDQRAEAARRLGIIREPLCTPHLVAALNDSSPAVRSAAVESLGQSGDPAAISALNDLLLRETSPQVPERLIENSIRTLESSEQKVEKPAPVEKPTLRVVEKSAEKQQVRPEDEAFAQFLDRLRKREESELVDVVKAVTEEVSSAAPPAAAQLSEDEMRLHREEEALLLALKELEQKRTEAEAARKKAEEDARSKAETEAQARAEIEARLRSEEEARRRAEEEAARRKAEEEARVRAEQQARLQAEEEARLRAEDEVRFRIEAETLRKAAEELAKKRAAAANARKIAEEEARKRAEEEARKRAEEEARKRAEEEARKRMEEETRRRAEEEARMRAEEEARRRAEEAARLRAAEEAQRRAEGERKLQEAETQRRLEGERLVVEQEALLKAAAEVSRRRAQIEEARKKAEEETQKLMAVEERIRQEEAERHRIEEERQRIEAEAHSRADEERRRLEELQRQVAEQQQQFEEEARRQVEEQSRRLQELEAARQRVEEESRQRSEQEKRIRSEIEALHLAEQEQRERIEAETRRRSEAEARLRQEEARRELEEQARIRAEAEAQRLAEAARRAEEARQRAEAEAHLRAEEATRLRAEEEARRGVEEEAKPRTDEEARMKAEEEARLWAEAETGRRAEAEAKLRAEQEAQEQLLRDGAAEAQYQARVSAGSASDIPLEVLTRLKSESPGDRIAALNEVLTFGGDDAFRLISDAFDDEAPEVQNAAARALYDLQSDRAASFTRALREGSPERRRRIGAALAASGLAGEAIGNLTGESREKTYDAFSLLFLMAKAGEVQPLMRAIEDYPNIEARLAVVKLLALSGQAEIVPAFRRLAVRGSLPSEVRSAVMEAIYQISSQTRETTPSAA